MFGDLGSDLSGRGLMCFHELRINITILNVYVQI